MPRVSISAGEPGDSLSLSGRLMATQALARHDRSLSVPTPPLSICRGYVPNPISARWSAPYRGRSIWSISSLVARSTWVPLNKMLGLRRGMTNGSRSICPAADARRVLVSSIIRRHGYVRIRKASRTQRELRIDRPIGARPICLSTSHSLWIENPQRGLTYIEADASRTSDLERSKVSSNLRKANCEEAYASLGLPLRVVGVSEPTASNASGAILTTSWRSRCAVGSRSMPMGERSMS